MSEAVREECRAGLEKEGLQAAELHECTCHTNYKLDTLIPRVGVITDIREETPDPLTAVRLRLP